MVRGDMSTTSVSTKYKYNHLLFPLARPLLGYPRTMLLVDFLRTLAKSPSFIVCSLILYFLGENLPSGLWLALHS